MVEFFGVLQVLLGGLLTASRPSAWDVGDADEAATGDLVLGVTLDQIDTFNRLVHAITVHGDVVAASDMAEYADGTLSQMGHVVFDARLEVRAVLDAVEAQRLAERTPAQHVREPHAAYGPGGTRGWASALSSRREAALRGTAFWRCLGSHALPHHSVSAAGFVGPPHWPPLSQH